MLYSESEDARFIYTTTSRFVAWLGAFSFFKKRKRKTGGKTIQQNASAFFLGGSGQNSWKETKPPGGRTANNSFIL